MKRKGQIIIGVALILIFIFIALAAPLLAPNDPNATNLALRNAPPSAEYPLGCDQMGRCELSRLLYGARYSMGLTIPALLVLAAFALFTGCYSSYKGGLLDEVMRILCDILMAFPLIVIAMALVSAVDNSAASVIIAIGISMLAWFLRMVRSYAKTECGKEYIEAARISGASSLRIVLRHLIPNVFPQFVVYFTTGIATAIMSVSSFAFLGVGADRRNPGMGRDAQRGPKQCLLKSRAPDLSGHLPHRLLCRLQPARRGTAGCYRKGGGYSCCLRSKAWASPYLPRQA